MVIGYSSRVHQDEQNLHRPIGISEGVYDECVAWISDVKRKRHICRFVTEIFPLNFGIRNPETSNSEK